MKTVFKEEFYSVNFRKDLSDTPLTETTVEPITDDTFFISGHTVHVKAVSKKGYFSKNVTGLTEGDIIEVECDVRNISGVKAKLGIDESNGLTTTSGRSNVLVKQSKGNGEWETLKVRYVVTNKYSNTIAHTINFGTFGGEVSEFYIRKARVRVFKQVSGDSVSLNREIGNDYIVTKYEDGIMEIEAKKTFNDVAITNPWGSVFTSANFQLGTWPTPFIVSPTVSAVGITDNSSSVLTLIATSPTSYTMPSVALTRGTTATIPSVTFHVMAKGRWK